MDKKTKKYLRSVRRRLNMPKALNERLMADFLSSIEARTEAGCSLDAILAELGTPKQAAAELNNQMKEYTYRKSPWRWIFLGLAVFSGLCLAYRGLTGLLLMLFNKAYNASIGIIGGADGPTAIFVSTSRNGMHATMGLYIILLLTGILGFFILRKLKQK